MHTATKTLAALLVMGSIAGAQPVTDPADGSAPAKTKRKAHRHTAEAAPNHEVEDQIRALREQMQTEQTQIDALKQQVSDRDAQLQQANAAAAAAQSAAQQAQNQASEAAAANTQAVNNLQGAVSDIRTTTTAVQTETTTLKKQVEMPDKLHYKGITFLPGGFLEFATVYRNRGIGGDINTQFTGIPYSGITAGHLGEFNETGRQSRLSLLAEGNTPNWSYRGYYEADFLSAGVTSNSNQSNSYTLRTRQLYAQAQSAPGTEQSWYFTGGQQWSLLTETRPGSGIENRSEALPLTIDAQYNAGFVWTRQPGLRAVREFTRHFWVGISAEQAQTTNIGGHGGPTGYVLYQQAGNTGGLYNSLSNYSYNEVPDFIAKAVYDGKAGHYELGGVISTFRDRFYPNEGATTGTPPVAAPSAAGAVNETSVGGGIEGSFRIDFAKKIDFGAKTLIGGGIERYGSSTLPEVIVKPDGSLEPLRGSSSLVTLELHPTPRFDVYSNFGVDYAQRELYTYNGKLYGYGNPAQNTSGCQTEVPPAASSNGGGNAPGATANCTADNRAIGELTMGYWYRFYKGPMGTFQQGMQYSYVERETWPGTTGSQKANDGMWFTSLRYYIP